MKILAFSDFHIDNEEFDMQYALNIIDKAYKTVSCELLNKETIIILICGDIINKGKPECFDNAKIVFDRLRDDFSSFNVKFRFVPGNHDLFEDSFKKFNDFILNYSDFKYDFSKLTVFNEQIENVNLIYASSIIDGEKQYGQLDYDAIESYIDNNCFNYLITHHGLFSEDNQGEKEAVIRGSSKLLNTDFCQPPQYIIHGHYHSDNIVSLSNNRLVVGIGSIFYERKNVNNQFSLLNLFDGKISSIYRYTYEDNHNYFQKTISYPTQEHRIMPTIKKSEEEIHLNYIPRKVAPFKEIQENNINLILNKHSTRSLLDLSNVEKHIVLLGEAGCGKSTELKYLEYQLSSSSLYFSKLIELKNYTTEEIDDLIHKYFSYVDYNKLFLIFDGYDEIESKNSKDFVRRINAFVELHPDTHIIISCRNNFYKFRDSNNSYPAETFTGFKEYGLCPLSLESIDDYILRTDTSPKKFRDIINANGLSDLIKNPFYLSEIHNLYEKGKIPSNKSNLMDAIIQCNFHWDSSKYINTTDLDDAEYDLMNLLKKLAFALQCMQKISITNKEYGELINESERNLLKHAGIWQKDNTNCWSFRHNNFREFLVARYLENLPLESIKELITYKTNRNKIKSSWQNVLSFWALSKDNLDLFNWIIEVDISSAIKFEHVPINDDIKEHIFIKLFNEYSERNMWISWDQNSEESIAKFGQTPNTLKFLLNEIKNPVHFRSQYNAITLLQNFSNLFGNEEGVKSVLLSCCESSNTRSYEKQTAILALAKLNLTSPEVTTTLFQIFKNSTNEEIRHGLYSYLLKSNLQDEFAAYLIDGLKLNEKYNSSSFSLKKAIESFNTIESIRLFLKYCSSRVTYTIPLNELFATSCKKLERLFPQNKKETYNLAFECMENIANKYNFSKIKYLKDFFYNTNTYENAIQRIIDSELDNTQKIFTLQKFDIPDYVKILIKNYNTNCSFDKELFTIIASKLDENSEEFKQCQKLVFDTQKIKISGQISYDYAKIELDGNQKYFDSLFNKHNFKKMLLELDDLLKTNDMVFDNTLSAHCDFTKNRYDLSNLIWAIKRTAFSGEKVIDFLDFIDWNAFYISEIYFMLNSIKISNPISVNKEQEQTIYCYCKEFIKSSNFNNIIRCNKNTFANYNHNIAYLSFFSFFFDFKYDDTVLLDMLLIPAYYFSDKNNYTYDFPQYLLCNIDDSLVTERVKQNIENLELHKDVLHAHIKYCEKHNLYFAVGIAKEICLSTDEYQFMQDTFKYLLAIKGEDYIYENILPFANKELLNIITYELYTRKNPKLEQRLIDINRKSKDKLTYLQYLIMMNSLYGLTTYFELALENHSIPDFCGDNSISHITDAIGSVNDPSLLPIIGNLIDLRFNSDFEDRRSFGLYNGLAKALKNIAAVDYHKTKNFLNEFYQNCNQDSELRGFCSAIMDDMDFQYYNNSEDPWTINQIKAFVKNN